MMLLEFFFHTQNQVKKCSINPPAKCCHQTKAEMAAYSAEKKQEPLQKFFMDQKSQYKSSFQISPLTQSKLENVEE